MELDFKDINYYDFDRSWTHKKLQTDKDGLVHMGKLEHVTYINVTISGQSAERYDLVTITEHYNYPSSLHILEGESLEIPYRASAASFRRPLVDLYKCVTATPSMLGSEFDKLEFQAGSAEGDFGKIKANGLAAGEYILMLREAEANIYIKVFKGTYWETEDFIVGE